MEADFGIPLSMRLTDFQLKSASVAASLSGVILYLTLLSCQSSNSNVP